MEKYFESGRIEHDLHNLVIPTTKEELNTSFIEAADGALKGILGVTKGEYGDPIVSMDFKGDPRSSIAERLSVSPDNYPRGRYASRLELKQIDTPRSHVIARMKRK
jgi:hypothetical protein